MTSTRAQRIADAAIALLAERGLRGLTHRAVDEAAGLPPGSTSNHARTRAALLSAALDRLAELEAAGFDPAASEPAASEPPASPLPMRTPLLSPLSPDQAPSDTESRLQPGPQLPAHGPGPDSGSLRGQGSQLPPLRGADSGSPREQLAAIIAGGLQVALTQGRAMTIARFELALEAGRRPELRARYDSLGGGFVEMVRMLLAGAGCPDPDRRARYLVSWCEGILFNATAGAGQADPPSAADLRTEVDLLLGAVLGP
jgi:AcrR family transcriptional regulator